MLIRDEAVRRQQCLTSVSMFTLSSLPMIISWSYITDEAYFWSTVEVEAVLRALRKLLATLSPSKTILEYSCSIAFFKNAVISAAELAKFAVLVSSSLLERKKRLRTPKELIAGSKLCLSSIVSESLGHTSAKSLSKSNATRFA